MHCEKLNTPAEYAAAFPGPWTNTQYIPGTVQSMHLSLRESGRISRAYGWAQYLYTSVVREATRGEGAA